MHTTLGALQFARGQPQAALGKWEQAAALYGAVAETAGYVNSRLNQVQAQQSLGYCQAARRTLATLSEHIAALPAALQVDGYRRLGQSYRLLGELNAAEENLQRALPLATTEAAGVWLELGNVAQARGDWRGAIATYQQAEQQAEQQAAATSDGSIQLKARLNRLQLLVQHNPEAAKAIAIEMPAAPGRSHIYAHIHAAQSLLRLATPEAVATAARLLAAAVQQSVDLGDRFALPSCSICAPPSPSATWPQATSPPGRFFLPRP